MEIAESYANTLSCKQSGKTCKPVVGIIGFLWWLFFVTTACITAGQWGVTWY